MCLRDKLHIYTIPLTSFLLVLSSALCRFYITKKPYSSSCELKFRFCTQLYSNTVICCMAFRFSDREYPSVNSYIVFNNFLNSGTRQNKE